MCAPQARVRTQNAKWIAVGGGAATALVAPPAGVAMSVATGFFLLMDP